MTRRCAKPLSIATPIVLFIGLVAVAIYRLPSESEKELRLAESQLTERLVSMQAHPMHNGFQDYLMSAYQHVIDGLEREHPLRLDEPVPISCTIIVLDTRPTQMGSCIQVMWLASNDDVRGIYLTDDAGHVRDYGFPPPATNSTFKDVGPKSALKGLRLEALLGDDPITAPRAPGTDAPVVLPSTLVKGRVSMGLLTSTGRTNSIEAYVSPANEERVYRPATTTHGGTSGG